MNKLGSKNDIEVSTNQIPLAENYSIRLYMAGDALLHGAVYNDAKQDDGSYDFSYMFENIAPLMGNCDLCYYNQETILGGTSLGLSSYPRFNSPQEFGDNMIDLGFNLVSTANNHSLDKDEIGIINSLEYWSDKPVVTAGTYLSLEDRDEIMIYEKNGITFAFLAYTYGTNGLMAPKGKEYLVNVYTEDMLVNDISKVRDIADVVIVSMHWGVEYTFTPTKEQEYFAKVLADADVDIVIGSHPHVIQPIEWIDDTIIFYSLGNMISAQDTLNKRIGMIGAIKINKTVINGKSKIEISQPKADLIYTYYDNNIKNFKIYLFSQLDNSILNNYEKIYEEYSKIIVEREGQIRIGGLE
ncbi:MAG: CapA family protein [Erysipelotrichaceae bacterium]|nr:CapA family protein [Erysipelotrichaceae bacterium]